MFLNTTLFAPSRITPMLLAPCAALADWSSNPSNETPKLTPVSLKAGPESGWMRDRAVALTVHPLQSKPPNAATPSSVASTVAPSMYPVPLSHANTRIVSCFAAWRPRPML
jgi:hypothetical protein